MQRKSRCDPKLVKQQRNEAIRDKVFLSLSTSDSLYQTVSWFRFHCGLRLFVRLKFRETLPSFKFIMHAFN